jgi:formate dehydrogenase iron-sulfur subunit
MSINRREFLKTLGVASASLSGATALGNSNSQPDQKEFFAILHDITLCEGCQECEVACAAANNNACIVPNLLVLLPVLPRP